MLEGLRRLFGLRKHDAEIPRISFDDPELNWFIPPEDSLDVSGWDRYWVEHVRNGIGPPIFDMCCDDQILVEVMRLEGMTSILVIIERRTAQPCR